jgi:hypothetical protein
LALLAALLSVFALSKTFFEQKPTARTAADPDIERLKHLANGPNVTYANVGENPDVLYAMYQAAPTPDAVITAYIHEALRHEGDLTLRDIGFITDNGMEQLRQAKKLRRISIVRNRMGDRIFDGIESLPLTSLNLGASDCTIKGLMRLSKMPTLRELNIDFLNLHSVPPSQETKKLFSVLSNINGLSIYACKLTDDDMSGIVKLRELRGLNIGQNGELTAKCLPYLDALPKLTELNIAGLPKLKATALSKTRLLPQLTTLNLSNNYYSALELGEIARKARSLEHLILSNSEVNDLGFLSFAETKTLSDVMIKHCPRISSKAIAEFQKKLPSCSIISN